jgi:hypothetical protein
MSKVFILYENTRHDFRDITHILPNSKQVFIYKKGDLEGLTIEKCLSTLTEVLDKADVDNDYIVLNGPSFLPACAGFVWFTQARKKNNILCYCPALKTYRKVQD